MYAVVRTGGKQVRVTPGASVRVEKLAGEVGESIELSDVLLVGGEGDLKIGTPVVEGAKVIARVVDHPRGDKVITFKYRPTRRFRRRVGFRHSHTTLEITGIEV